MDVSDDERPPSVYEEDNSSGEESIGKLHDQIEKLEQTDTNREDLGDGTMLDASARVTALNYVAEHRIFLKAILELLSQRDTYSGIEVDINDPNTIKAGPLKKASHLRGAWKIKYVEVRKGLLSYYENDTRDIDQILVRKNIALHASTCTLRKVMIQGLRKNSPSGGPGAAFEVAVEGRPKKIFLASSREDRQAWLNAIKDAMVGGSVVRGESDVTHHLGRRGVISPRSPYKKDLDDYLRVQTTVRESTTKEEYVTSLATIMGQSVEVPVQWIRERTERLSTEHRERSFLEEDTSTGVDQLFKDLQRDSVSINGELFRGASCHGSDKIICALARSIMMLDKSFADQANTYPTSRNAVTESQALSYARDILLAGNRTRSGGDSYFCVDTLCKNQELAVLCPSTAEAEPLSITVEATVDARYTNSNDLSGWLKTRSRSQKPWKKRYFVLSGGTLSYYEKAQPRPHGLRGQMVLQHASLQISIARTSDGENEKLSSSEHAVLSILMNDGSKDRHFSFDDDSKLFLWAQSFQDAIERNPPRSPSLTKAVVSKIRRSLREEVEDDVTNGELAGDSGPFSLKDYASRQGIDDDNLRERVAVLRAKSGKAKAAVKTSVKASTEYKICTVDPQGDEDEDTWAYIRASFLQSFDISGGLNGRMKRGGETVQICVQDRAPVADRSF